MEEDGGSGRNRQSQHRPQEARPKVRGCFCICLAAIRQFCIWHCFCFASGISLAGEWGPVFFSFLTINYLRKKWDHVTMM